MSLLTFVREYYGREEILKCRSLRVLSVSLFLSLSLSREKERTEERETERASLKEEEEDLATTKDRAAKVSRDCFCVYFRVFSCFFFLFSFFSSGELIFFLLKKFLCFADTTFDTHETEERKHTL